MDTIFLNKDTELLIIGDINGNKILFDLVIEHCLINNIILVSLGNFYPQNVTNEMDYIVNNLKQLQSQNKAYIIKGNHEYRNLLNSRLLDDNLLWCNSLPLALSFVFSNQSRLTIVHGGISPKCTWADISSRTDCMYLNIVDKLGNPVAKKGIPWYDLYDGRFGYVISSYLPNNDAMIKYHKHSCNINTNCNKTGILLAPIINNGKMKNVIEFRIHRTIVED